MENPVNYLVMKISTYFVQQTEDNYRCNKKFARSLVRVHNHKLEEYGDVAVCHKLDIWKKFYAQVLAGSDAKWQEKAFQIFSRTRDGVGAGEVERARRTFLLATRAWPFPVERIHWQGERCALFLNRRVLINEMLRRVLQPAEFGLQSSVYGYLKKNAQKRVVLKRFPGAGAIANFAEEEDITYYRAKLMDRTLRKVIEYSEWNLIDEDSPEARVRHDNMDHDGENHGQQELPLHLQVISVRSLQQQHQQQQPPNDIAQPMMESTNPSEYVQLKCGIVVEPSDGRLCRMKTSEYIKLRTTDINLLALHKYGYRAPRCNFFEAFLEKLGKAAVDVDLLEVKHSSPVQIIRNGKGSTKGAPFILYNSARIETLIRAFNERVAKGVYDPLPEMDGVNFTLLTESEEWHLVYSFIFGFPNLIEQCLEQLERGLCSTHLIIRFLSDLAGAFSAYYRRVRILTESRDQLMPYVYARIYLVKAVREIYNKALAMLDVKPVQYM